MFLSFYLFISQPFSPPVTSPCAPPCPQRGEAPHPEHPWLCIPGDAPCPPPRPPWLVEAVCVPPTPYFPASTHHLPRSTILTGAARLALGKQQGVKMGFLHQKKGRSETPTRAGPPRPPHLGASRTRLTLGTIQTAETLGSRRGESGVRRGPRRVPSPFGDEAVGDTRPQLHPQPRGWGPSGCTPHLGHPQLPKSGVWPGGGLTLCPFMPGRPAVPGRPRAP